MDELLHKKVKIIFNSSAATTSGLIGTTCVILNISNGFVVVKDSDEKVSYYVLSSIKSITLIEERVW